MDTIFVATLDTRNFSFSGAGRTREQAHAAVFDAWGLHCRQTGADPTYIHECTIDVTEMRLGAGYRDGELLTLVQPVA
jgi:hypothetical protein